MSIFYNVFQRLCAERGVTPASVVHACGLSSAAVSGWKRGKVPHDATLQRLADYFGVTVDYLQGKEEGYYVDEETAELAQELFDNPDLRALLDTAADASPEDIKTAITMLKALKRKDNNGL